MRKRRVRVPVDPSHPCSVCDVHPCPESDAISFIHVQINQFVCVILVNAYIYK